MSGGFFDYQQDRMKYLADDLNDFLFGKERNRKYHQEELSNKDFVEHLEDLSWQLVVLHAKIKEVDYILSSDSSVSDYSDVSYLSTMEYKTKQEYIEVERKRYAN